MTSPNSTASAAARDAAADRMANQLLDVARERGIVTNPPAPTTPANPNR